VIEGIVIAVVAAIVIATGRALWKRRGALSRMYREQREADMTMKREDAAEELRALREQVSEVARTRNDAIPISSRGTNPTIVTLSDVSMRYYFRDHAAYVRAMRAGQVPPTRTFRGTAPVPVSRWTRDLLKQWLADNSR